MEKHDKDKACRVLRFDHIVFWVANAKTSASFYVTRLGFKPLAVREPSEQLQTLAYAVTLNQIVLVFESPVTADGDETASLARHGDFVKDIALRVDDMQATAALARQAGAVLLQEPRAAADRDGVVTTAVLQTYGDNSHTLVDRSKYRGLFLPGYKAIEDEDPLSQLLPDTGLEYIDHVESNMTDGTLDQSIKWYEDNLKMHRFWCGDYEWDVTPYSGIRSLSVANNDQSVRLQLNEGAKGLRASNKATEYVQCHGGPGVEHIALYTRDIVATMRALKARGAEVVAWPAAYYDIVRERLASSPVKVDEDISELQRLQVLLDYDSCGYMLQAFTKHTQPRHTVFVELIQRRNDFKGFGAGNYKTVFEALERLDAEKLKTSEK